MFLKNDSGHLMCQFEGRRGTRKGSSLSSTYISEICLQHIFPQLFFTHTPSPQKKRGGGGGLRRVLITRVSRKRQLLLVSFLMISAEENSSGTK